MQIELRLAIARINLSIPLFNVPDLRGAQREAAAAPGSSLATGDLDGDEGTDVVLNNLDTKPDVLHNATKGTGYWLELRLVGDVSKKSPKDATGTIVYLTTGKLPLRVDLFS